MKVLKSKIIQAATIQMEDREEHYPESRYTVLWKGKDKEKPIFRRSLQDAEEYYECRCRVVEQRRI